MALLKNRLSEFHKFDGKHMAVFIYIEKKTFFLLLKLGNQCQMWILSSGSPQKLT